MWTCGDVHKWSGEAETLADPPAEASAHLAECDHCLRKVRLLQRAATLSREASRSPQPSIPDFDTVSRAAAPSLRGVRWSFAAAAAILATLAIAWWAVRPGVDERPARRLQEAPMPARPSRPPPGRSSCPTRAQGPWRWDR